MNSVLQGVMVCMLRQQRGILMCLFAGLTAAGLSACGGSSPPVPRPVTAEPVASEPAEGAASQGAVETTETAQSTEELIRMLDSPGFRSYAARTMGTQSSNVVPRETYEVAGTGCQARLFDYAVREMDGNATHFAVTPTGERIAGSVEGAIQAVWSACYESQGIQISSDQLVRLVVNFSEIRFAEAEDESTMLALQRNSVDYEPPTFVQDGDNFTLTFLLNSQEFGDIYRVRVERSGDDMTVDYEELRRG